MKRWFKMPSGTAQNAIFGIIAQKHGVKTPHVIGLFTAASDLFEAGNDYEATVEMLGFTFQVPEREIDDILKALQNRGVFAEDWSISGIEKTTPAAERKRRQRDREKAERDMSQDSHVTVTTPSRDMSHLERPEQNRKTREKDQSNVTRQARDTAGSFPRVSGVGSVGRFFDIQGYLQDDDFIDIRRDAPDWDLNVVFDKYSSWVEQNGKPNSPRKAFLAWLPKFTKRRAP